MALSGLHVACGFAGGPNGANQPLLSNLSWSQTMAAPGTTDNGAPEGSGNGQPVMQFRASADAFVAVGRTPNAVSGARIFVPAGETVSIYVSAGDKAAWVAA